MSLPHKFSAKNLTAQQWVSVGTITSVFESDVWSWIEPAQYGYPFELANGCGESFIVYNNGGWHKRNASDKGV